MRSAPHSIGRLTFVVLTGLLVFGPWGCKQPDEAVPAPPAARTQQAATSTGLVVHEWGTFTSMQSASGVLLGGMHHDDAPLPGFVIRTATRWAQLADGTIHEPTQRMETPVIYLHTDRRMEVDVRVTFPSGLMSEWYPECAELLPAGPAAAEIAGGALRWKVDVDPDLDPALSPAVAADNIWAPSRRVKVPSLRNLAVRSGVDRPVGEVERFLFYRGVGRFELPVRVQATDAKLTVTNLAQRRVEAAFLLVVHDDMAGFVALGALAGKTPQAVPLPAPDRPLSDIIAEARGALIGALEASGLYHDESVALVDTWNDSYFKTQGARVLYVLPQAWTDALLPLTVKPKPDKIVRTLVGRIEVLTPGMQTQILARLQSGLVGLPTHKDGAARLAAQLALVADLQPYAESKLLWACADLQDKTARSDCDAMQGLAHVGW